jgi:UDP-N-acetylmuramoyl-tripeptide--D-alanyl-D-alanine ligase
MENVRVQDIINVTNGRLLCGNENISIENIIINSKDSENNALFVPIIGERVDAHNFISEALQNGAAASLTSKKNAKLNLNEVNENKAVILVEDTLKALQALAKYYRKRFTLPIVGVTGSVGKTSTREMIAAALSAKYKTFKTKKNLNGQIGVPITLSNLSNTDEIAVLEMGISEENEMEKLVEMVRPDVAVITNIGIAHIEQLGSKENIRNEKLKIIDKMFDCGKVFLNADDDMLLELKDKLKQDIIYYGLNNKAQYYAKDIDTASGFPEFIAVCRGTEIKVKLSVIGKHNVQNAMVALAVADCYGVFLKDAVKEIENYKGAAGRGKILYKNDIIIIDDVYNASPDSMISGLNSLLDIQIAGKKIAVLADMKELGAESIRYHREIGEYIADKNIDILICIGELAKEIAVSAKSNPKDTIDIQMFASNILAIKYLKDNIKGGDAVWIKGSNSMKLNEIIESLAK